MSGYERSLVDMFIPVSQAVADLVEIGKARSRVIPNFVLDDFDSNGTSDDTPSTRLPDRPYLLYAGDLRLFKGIQVLLAAYAGIANAPPLVLIGRKDADTPASFPDNVIITGPLSHEQVLEAWRGSLMGLMPSIGPEAFGIAALEAMSAGRPVIASRIGGLPEIIRDGESGLLVPPGDHVALRRAIERLLADPALLARMGEAARRRAMEFRASVIVPQIEQAYKEVMESGK
jgi:glycosyltransferase involved in cell wall biosynthesis